MTVNNASIALKPESSTFAYMDRCGIYAKMGLLKEAAQDAETFFQLKHLSQRDKDEFSKSGQCHSLVKGGFKVHGCRDLEYFKEYDRKLLEQAEIYREKHLRSD